MYSVQRFLVRVRRILILLGAWLVNQKCSCDDDTVVLTFFGALGDFTIWLAAARELRKIYRGSTITLCCTKESAELAATTGYFDHIVPVDYEAIKLHTVKLWRARRNFTEIKCNLLIQCFYMEDHFAATIRAKTKLCIYQKSTHALCKWIKSRIYDDFLPFDQVSKHRLLQQGNMLRALGWEGKVQAQELHKTKTSISIEGEYFVIFPGSAWADRRWAIEKFAEAAIQLGQTKHLKCCICGGRGECKLAEKFLQLCSGRLDVLDMTGKTDVLQLVEVIRNARLVLTNDTSAVHIAVGTRTPSVCIYGLWDANKTYLPYPNTTFDKMLPILCCEEKPCHGCNLNFTAECLACIARTGRRLCIDAVPITAVVRAAERVLDSGNGYMHK